MKKLILLFTVVFFSACNGGPDINIVGECLADSQCESGYFCNDKARCERVETQEDGDSDNETSEQTDSEQETN